MLVRKNKSLCLKCWHSGEMDVFFQSSEQAMKNSISWPSVYDWLCYTEQQVWPQFYIRHWDLWSDYKRQKAENTLNANRSHSKNLKGNIHMHAHMHCQPKNLGSSNWIKSIYLGLKKLKFREYRFRQKPKECPHLLAGEKLGVFMEKKRGEKGEVSCIKGELIGGRSGKVRVVFHRLAWDSVWGIDLI